MASGLEMISKENIFRALIRYYPGGPNAALRDMAQMELSKARRDMLSVNRLIEKMKRGKTRAPSLTDGIGKGLTPDDPYAAYGAKYTRALKCALRLEQKIKTLEKTIEKLKGEAEHGKEKD